MNDTLLHFYFSTPNPQFQTLNSKLLDVPVTLDAPTSGEYPTTYLKIFRNQ